VFSCNRFLLYPIETKKGERLPAPPGDTQMFKF